MVGIWGENDLSKIAYLFHSECIPLSGKSIHGLEHFLDYEYWPAWPIPHTGGLIIPAIIGDGSRIKKGDLWGISGVYALLLNYSPFDIDYKIYVGQSKNVEERILNHASKLRNGTHDNWKLQEAFKEESLAVLLLERIDDESKLLEKEQAWISLVPTKDRLNIMSGDVKPKSKEERTEPTFIEKFLIENEEITISTRLVFEREEVIKLVNIMQRYDISSIKELLLSLK